MKRLILGLFVVCSVSQGTCKTIYVMDAIDRPGRIVTVCAPETETAPMPMPMIQPRPVMPDLLKGTMQNNFNPFGGVSDAFNQGLRRGMQ